MSLPFLNPWDVANWSITAQMRFVKDHGLPTARAYARAAGVELGALRPAPTEPAPKVQARSYIISKKIITEGSRGYSGEGPPED